MDLLARGLCAAVFAALVLMLAATSADATHTRSKCKQAGATIAKNDTARVFKRFDSVYGCIWSRNRAARIDRAYLDESAYVSHSWDDVRLAGRYVAWTSSTSDVSCKADCPPGYDATALRVNVIDLRTQQKQAVAGVPAGATLRVTARGAVVWLERIGNGRREVHAWLAGEERVLDTGPIRSSSYSVRGDTLRWANGDVARVVTLR